MKRKKLAVVFLGVNGTLSTAVIENIADKTNKIDMIGFDVQTATPLPVKYYRCDLASRNSIRDAIVRIPYRQYQDIRLLICASVMNTVQLNSMTLQEDALYDNLQINLGGQLHFATAFAQKAIEAGTKARVVFVGSTAAYVGSNDIAYAAAKAGLDGAARSLSKYYGPQGITAGVVHTGIFESAMSAKVSDERKAKTVGMTHVHRVGAVKEIRKHVQYYLLDAPDFATSFITEINGGQHS